MSNLVRTISSTNDDAAPTSSTALTKAGGNHDPASRPRNRRAGSSKPPERTASSSRLNPSTDSIRAPSPIPSARLGTAKLASNGRSSPAAGAQSFGKGLLEGSWAPSWSSVQDFASSILTGRESGYNSETSRPSSRNGNKVRRRGGSASQKLPESWGPAPPAKGPRPRAEDIAAGSLAKREATLKAMKTASILESYEGVNGGLDVAGKFKRRNSDEFEADRANEANGEEQLAYVHHVQDCDTYAGIVLRYRCQEQAFRRANGLWSRDNIQVRKILLIPVDACEVRGRPCDPPEDFYNQNHVDHLATTPQPESYIQSGATASTGPQSYNDDFFSSKSDRAQTLTETDQPWTHLRWVKIDSFQDPVEIVRVSRRAMGFFPPRRKKSVHTASVLSSPRYSLEFPGSNTAGSSALSDSPPEPMHSRRQSSLDMRPTIGSLGTSSSASRSRVSSLGAGDGIPVWMKKPGGVGTMSRSVKAPGPAKDYFNTWVNRRLPGLNIDSMPSMSVMGAETVSWGFNKPDEEAPGIVESPFEDGRDANLARTKSGTGLEQAAATMETWLRGVWAKRPATPRLGSHRKPPEDLDLIELTDTNSDDGRTRSPSRMPDAGLLGSSPYRSPYRGGGSHSGEGTIRGRSAGPSYGAKAGKAD